MPTKSQQSAADYILKPSEIKKLILACDGSHGPRDRCIIKLFAYTGMRRAELQQLDIQDLDYERNRIHIRAGKGDKERMIPVDRMVMSDLRFLLQGRQKGPVFLSQKGGRLAVTHINRIVDKIAQKAGIDNPNPRRKTLNPHIFRHSFGRNARKLGVPAEKIQQILGHSSVKTTIDIYGTPSVDDTQEDYIDKIEGIFG